MGIDIVNGEFEQTQSKMHNVKRSTTAVTKTSCILAEKPFG